MPWGDQKWEGKSKAGGRGSPPPRASDKHTGMPHPPSLKTVKIIYCFGFILVLASLGFGWLAIDVGRQTSSGLMDSMRIATGTTQMLCACNLLGFAMVIWGMMCFHPEMRHFE